MAPNIQASSSSSMIKLQKLKIYPKHQILSRITSQTGDCMTEKRPNGNSSSITLCVRLPSQQTMKLEIGRNIKTATQIKRAICNRMGLPDNADSVYLSHQGKTFDTNFDKITSESIENYHLTTVQVSLVLPGGSMTTPSQEMSAQEISSHLVDKKVWNVKFWMKMSHQQQAQALTLLTQRQIANLLDSLDQEALCLTISMHQDMVFLEGKHLIDLLMDDEKILAAKTFIKFGRSSKTDCSSEQFIKKLADQQYADYRSIKNLQQNFEAKQIIQNPSAENGMITLQDYSNKVEFYHDDQKYDSDHSKGDQRPIILHPTQVDGQQEERLNGYKEWKMDQINPDPSANELNKSTIACYEYTDNNYYCTQSFTIANRMSKLYTGQDGDVFIFSRDRPTTDLETEGADKEVNNNIQLHVFRFVKLQTTTGQSSKEDQSEKFFHKIYTIDQDGHLGQELLKKEQVKKGYYGQQYMDQAPNLIRNEESNLLLLTYTSAKEESGASLYFYDLEKGRTCVSLKKAELFIDCHPSQTDARLTNIRYIQDDEIFVRSVDFSQALMPQAQLTSRQRRHSFTVESPREQSIGQEKNPLDQINRPRTISQLGLMQNDQSSLLTEDQQIYNIPLDNLNLITRTKITLQGEEGSYNWIYRYRLEGKSKEVSVHIDNQQNHTNYIQQAFQLLFKTRENYEDVAYSNWCACFQSYEEMSPITAERKTLTFKMTKIITYAEFVVTKRINDDAALNADAKTFVISADLQDSRYSKQVWLTGTWTSQTDLKTNDTKLINPSLTKNNCYKLQFDEELKTVFPVIFKQEDSLIGLVFSKNSKKLSYFLQEQGSKQTKPKLQQIMQEKKLQMNNYIATSYPFLFYTGLTPECREIIFANLADTQQPQKIIQLPDGLQFKNFIRSHQDDRIQFQAYDSNRKQCGEYEILIRFPFKQLRDGDQDISIRQISNGNRDYYAENASKVIQIDLICDSCSLSSQLVSVYRSDKHKLQINEQEMVKPKNKIVLQIQRSNKNNLYWIEKTPSQGSILRGVIDIGQQNSNKQCQSTQLNDYNLNDATFISIVAESKLSDGGEQQELITVLDSELNLQQFIVNEKTERFQPFCEPINLDQQLKLDANWLNFNGKLPLDFESYKENFRLFSSETLGVTFKDYIVYYNTKSQAFSMVDTNHKEFPINMTTGDSENQIKWTKSIDGTDFRLMELTKVKGNKQEQSDDYFVFYPAPESRKLDLFGFQGRRSNVSASFISENFVLAQFHYRDIYRPYHCEGSLRLDQHYWSLIDQAGQIKSMPFSIESNSSIIFSKHSNSGAVLIFEEKSKQKIVKFNLKGELIYEHTFDDEDIMYRTFDLIQKLGNAAPEKQHRIEKLLQDPNEREIASNKFRYSNNFLQSREGRLYRLASILSLDQDIPTSYSQLTKSFSLCGAIHMPIDSQNQKIENLAELTVLVFECKSEAQYQQFQESEFCISNDSLCIYSPKFTEQVIRIIDLKSTFRKEAYETTSFIDYNEDNFISISKVVESNDQCPPQKTKTQILEEHKNVESLRVMNVIRNRSFMVVDKSQDDQNGKDDNAEVLPALDSRKIRELTQHKKDFALINFDQKALERKIDIRNLIHRYSSRDLSLKLDSLELTPKKLQLRVDEHEVAKDQNYLQISLPNRVFLYDLNFEDPKECFSCFETNFFTDHKNFIDLGLSKIWSKAEQKVWTQVETNQQRNLFMTKEIVSSSRNSSSNVVNEQYCQQSSRFVTLLKNYSQSDVQGLNWLFERLRYDDPIQATSFESMMVTYQGHNFFSMTNEYSHLKVMLEFIHAQIETRQEEQAKIVAGEGGGGSTISPYLRRIYRVLSLPVPEFTDSKKSKSLSDEKIYGVNEDLALNFESALEKSIDFNLQLRDLFIQFSENSNEFDLSDFARDQTRIEQMLQSYSTALNEFLTNQVIETPITEEIQMLQWPADTQNFTFQMPSQAVSQKHVQERVKKHFGGIQSFNLTPVKVKLLKTNWLLQNGGTFPKFSSIVQNSSSNRIFDNDLMKGLVSQYWQDNQLILKWCCFFPWLLYLFTTNILFAIIFKSQSQDMRKEGTDDYDAVELYSKYVLSALTLFLLCIQLYIEKIQLGEVNLSNLSEYLGDTQNVQDLVQFTSTIWITVSNIPKEGSAYKYEQRVVAALSLLLIWIKIFDWALLFPVTSFYTKLIGRTLREIKPFMLLYIAALAMFGTSIFMLQDNVPQGEDANSLIDPVFGVYFLDLLLNQYFLSLGEFATDGFEGHERYKLLWILFLMATFFTQITMLNMLIAIMGNVFEGIQEQKDATVLQNQLQTLSSYEDFCSLFGKDNTDTFLFIVTPDAGEEDSETWGGGLNLLKSTMNKNKKHMDKKLDQQSDQAREIENKIKTAFTKINEKTRDEIKDLKRRTANQIEDLKYDTAGQIQDLKKDTAEEIKINQIQTSDVIKANQMMTSEEIKDLKKDLLEEIKNLLKQADVLHKTEVEQEEEEQKFNF